MARGCPIPAVALLFSCQQALVPRDRCGAIALVYLDDGELWPISNYSANGFGKSISDPNTRNIWARCPTADAGSQGHSEENREAHFGTPTEKRILTLRIPHCKDIIRHTVGRATYDTRIWGGSSPPESPVNFG